MLLADPNASPSENLCGNVLTAPMDAQVPEILANQGFQGIHPARKPGPYTYSVKDEEVEKGSERGLGKARRKRRKPGKRGPKGSSCLSSVQVRQVVEFSHQAGRVHMPLNVCVTCHAPKGMSDAEGKRIISRRIAHFGQKLKQHGQEHVGVTIYEKHPYLHAHHLVHVRSENMDLVMAWHEGEAGDVHVRGADRYAPIYVTKQRRWLGPEIEAERGRRPWKKGAYIAGPRLSFTKEAKAIMARWAGRAAIMSAAAHVEARQPKASASIPPAPSEPLPVVTATPPAQGTAGEPLPATGRSELLPLGTRSRTIGTFQVSEAGPNVIPSER